MPKFMAVQSLDHLIILNMIALAGGGCDPRSVGWKVVVHAQTATWTANLDPMLFESASPLRL